MEQDTETVKRAHRRLALLKRTGLFNEAPYGTEITRACSLQDLQLAYRLVYDVFLAAGYTTPHECRMRIRIFEALADTATFIAKREGQIIGVLSLVLDSPGLGLPSDVAFKDELNALRSGGIKLCETTNQAIVPRFRKTAVTTQMMRCCSAQGLLENRDGIIISVSPSHVGFYELLGFQLLSDVRSYSSRHYDPVVMMCLYTAELRQRDPTADLCQAFIADYLSFKNPFVQKVKIWKQSAYDGFYEAHELRKVFVDESKLLETCTDAEREAVRNNWGEGTYISVTGAVNGRPKARQVGGNRR